MLKRNSLQTDWPDYKRLISIGQFQFNKHKTFRGNSSHGQSDSYE